MSWAVCTRCGKEIHWTARRGTRLADLQSACCHAPLRAFRRDPGAPSKAKGVRYGRCTRCGHRKAASGLRVLLVDAEVFWTHEAVPKGSALCYFCRCSLRRADGGDRPKDMAAEDWAPFAPNDAPSAPQGDR